MNSPDADLLDQAIALLQAGRTEEAATRCRDLLGRNPNVAPAHNLLGFITCRSGDLAAGQAHFARAASIEPGNSEYRRNLGIAQKQLGRLAEAAASLDEAVRLNPGDAVALHELGALRHQQGDPAGAVGFFRRALDQEPGNPVLRMACGNALAALGELDAAAGEFLQAVAQAPGLLEAKFALANVQGSRARHAEAVALYEDIERIRPDYPHLQVNLGAALRKIGRCAEAVRHYDLAIAQDPADHVAYNNRGNALYVQQRMEEAATSFRRALQIKPDYVLAHQNLLLTMNYTERAQEAIYRESLEFERRHAARPAPAMTAFTHDRDPHRRLRVGYVSSDFRRHSVAYFIQGVLGAHDRSQVEVFCYANHDRPPDDMTARIRSCSDHWRPVIGLADDQLAIEIGKDGIDILVDLNGHTAGNRLMVFALRPAPVQVTWLGYPNTTGLRTIDYRLTDAVADPPGADDFLHSERLIRLAAGFQCYQPGELPPLAASTAGRPVTFGSFNNLAKQTPEVAATWSAILRGTPGSRLLLKAESLDEAQTRRRFLGMFGDNGISADRLVLVPPIEDRQQHLAAYGQVDIALDPFPFNGATTTFEALCMGVPVIALRGNRHAGRVGASILHHAGLPDWVAETEAEYVALAISRAADTRALAALRPDIRAAIRASPLMDVARFTVGLERAYRGMWAQWCEDSG